MPLDISTLNIGAVVKWTTKTEELTVSQRRLLDLQLEDKGEGPFIIQQIQEHPIRSCTCRNKDHHAESCPEWIVEHLGEYKKLIVVDEGGQEFEIFSFYLDYDDSVILPAEEIAKVASGFCVLIGFDKKLSICSVEDFEVANKNFLFDTTQGICWIWNDRTCALGEVVPYSSEGGFIVVIFDASSNIMPYITGAAA